jgi:parallel beta-helix repeat protein
LSARLAGAIIRRAVQGEFLPMRTAVAALLLFSAAPLAAKTIAVAPSANDQETIQTALIEAAPGDTVSLAPGRYTLGDGLSLDVDRVTVKGAGPGRTVLGFKGQQGAGEGLLVTSDGVLLTGFAVENTKGDGIKAKGVDRISFVDLRVEWTNGPDAKNGAYGVYPVSSTNVLVDGVTVRGASDAGIYVGQSKQIVVRNSLAEHNVAGIEIENSMFADVYGNTTRGNTGGILVFDLPNLPQMGGHSARIHDNIVVDNDTPNFAPPGNTVAQVPQGLGIMVMANDRVEVFGNRIDGNRTAAVMIVAYRQPFQDPSYNPLPRNVLVSGNDLGKNGWDPKFPGGAELAAAVGGTLPPVLWDGVTTWSAAPAGQKFTTTPIADVPALSLGLGTAGTDLAKAKPAPLPPTPGKPALVEVELPADQPGLAAGATPSAP